MGGYSDLTIIIPTLNESRNIRTLIGILARHYNGVSIIVSDDGSRDGTAEIVREISRRNKRIKLIDRTGKPRGLAASVMDAVLVARTDKVIVMDGDLQHPYIKVGKLHSALDRSDLVIGVRTTINDWSLHRKALSKGMSYLAYTTFKIRGKPVCRDMMSGFFGARRKFLADLIKRNRSAFVGGGYKLLLDILRVSDQGTRIAEVPYGTFHDRRHGSSKLGPRQFYRTIISIMK